MGDKYIKDGKLYEKGGWGGDKELGTVEKGGIFSQDTVKMHGLSTPDMKIERTGLLGEHVDIVGKDTLSEFIEGKREGTRLETETNILNNTNISHEWTQELGGAKIPKSSVSSGGSSGKGGGGSSNYGSSSSTSSSGFGSSILIIAFIVLVIGAVYGLTNSSHSRISYPAQQYTSVPSQPPVPATVSAPVQPEVNITKAVIAEELDSNNIPVGTSNRFSAGNRTLYFYISYNGAIANETEFVYRWYKDDIEFSNSSFTLAYASGNAWNSASIDFEPGAYDVRLYSNNKQLEKATFNVLPSSDNDQKVVVQQHREETERLQRQAEYQQRQYEEQQRAAEQQQQREAYQQHENTQRRLERNQWQHNKVEQQRRETEFNQLSQRNRWQAEPRPQRQVRQQQQRVFRPRFPGR